MTAVSWQGTMQKLSHESISQYPLICITNVKFCNLLSNLSSLFLDIKKAITKITPGSRSIKLKHLQIFFHPLFHQRKFRDQSKLHNLHTEHADRIEKLESAVKVN